MRGVVVEPSTTGGGGLLSRLPGEPADGVEDIHYHVFQPRSVRASLRYSF